MTQPPSPADTVVRPTALDAQALARLRELDPDGRGGVVLRVMRTFERSLAQMLTALHAAAERQDVTELHRLAHTLKSSSASVGAPALSAACARLESLVRDRREMPSAEVLVELFTVGEHAQAAVHDMLAASGTLEKRLRDV